MEEQLTFLQIAAGISAPPLDGEKRLLEMVSSGCPLGDVPETICGLVQAIASKSTCSILLIDSNGTFRHGAALQERFGFQPERIVATPREPVGRA